MDTEHKQALQSFYQALVDDCQAFEPKHNVDYSEYAFDSVEVTAAFNRLADLIEQMVAEEKKMNELEWQANEQAIEREWKRTRGV